MFFLVANLVVFRKNSGRFTNFGSGNTYNHLFVLVSFLFRHLQKVRYLYQIRLHVCILFCFLCSFNRTNVFYSSTAIFATLNFFVVFNFVFVLMKEGGRNIWGTWGLVPIKFWQNFHFSLLIFTLEFSRLILKISFNFFFRMSPPNI